MPSRKHRVLANTTGDCAWDPRVSDESHAFHVASLTGPTSRVVTSMADILISFMVGSSFFFFSPTPNRWLVEEEGLKDLLRFKEYGSCDLWAVRLSLKKRREIGLVTLRNQW